MVRRPASSTLFPYTTLFRSTQQRRRDAAADEERDDGQRPHDWEVAVERVVQPDRKSTRLNSSHGYISYAVFCLKKKIAIQRLMNAMRQAHADGWFLVFDTLTLADDRLEAVYDNPNALRDYFGDIGRMVLAAEGCKVNDSHAESYQYFCVPE